MDSELHATELKCRDGFTISVHAPGPRLTIVTAPDDGITAASPLSRYRWSVDAPPGYALYTGMPVEAVRAYCALHGGVAQIGRTAQTLLRALPSEADAPTVPASKTRPVLFTDAPASAGKPRLPIDDLTTAVIEARRAFEEITGPVTWRWGKRPSDKLEAVATHERRISRGRGLASRLVIVGHAQYARHPLLVEAIRLREQLDIAAANSLAALENMRAEDLARAQAANGIRPPDES